MHCRLANAVRVFKLPAGPEDYAIMLTSDYEAAVGACRQEASTSGAAAKQPALLRVFDWFCERVLPRCSEVMITRLQLLKLLGTDPNT